MSEHQGTIDQARPAGTVSPLAVGGNRLALRSGVATATTSDTEAAEPRWFAGESDRHDG